MKRFIPTLILIGACLCFTVLATHAEDKPAGADLFKQKCSMCHGAEGKGFAALKTPDFTDPKWQKTLKDKDIIETIKNGKKGTPMPSFADKLKEDELQELVSYIRSLNIEKKK